MGRAQFSKGTAGDQGVLINQTSAGELKMVQAMAESEEVAFISSVQTGDIAVSAVESTTIRAPTGYLYELLHFRADIEAPAGSASGTHYLALESESLNMAAIFGRATFDNWIKYWYGYWYNANSAAYPTQEISQTSAIKGLRVDETNGIVINYSNNTDVIQTKPRTYKLWVRKIKVA